MKSLLIVFALASLVPAGYAEPAAPAKKEDLVKRADLIVVVKITEVVEELGKAKPFNILIRSTRPEIERVVKGAAPKVLELEQHEVRDGIACKPPPLAKGRFLVFLKHSGETYIPSDYWWIYRIEQDKLNWYFETKSVSDVVSEILELVRKEKT